jgi:heme-binding protein
MRHWKQILLGLGVIIAGIQLVPVSRSNPAITGEVPAPAQVREVLQRACLDCHSHETRWPWYAYVAPVSWLIEHDVEEGREHLNLSAWDAYASGKRTKLFKEIREEIEEGAMPPWYYLTMHPSARLSERDLALLRGWLEEGGQE